MGEEDSEVMYYIMIRSDHTQQHMCVYIGGILCNLSYTTQSCNPHVQLTVTGNEMFL